MENQHRRIVGYRDLTAEDINLMNAIKQAGAAFAALDKLVGERIKAQFAATNAYISIEDEQKLIDALPAGDRDIPTGLVKTEAAEAEWARLIAAEPHRWRSIAMTDMQRALMALTRAVAQPSSF